MLETPPVNYRLMFRAAYCAHSMDMFVLSDEAANYRGIERFVRRFSHRLDSFAPIILENAFTVKKMRVCF